MECCMLSSDESSSDDDMYTEENDSDDDIFSEKEYSLPQDLQCQAGKKCIESDLEIISCLLFIGGLHQLFNFFILLYS